MIESHIDICDVEKIFISDKCSINALKNITISIPKGQFLCLLGPSGCGKSTLLNTIAGFIFPDKGKIAIDGMVLTSPGPDRGMVFQEYALFPWMNVEANIAFGLEIKKYSRDTIKRIVDDLLCKLLLQDFRFCFPKDLSGGMRQRVAIARILALDSSILLMDEPFGALDALTRRTLQDELLRIWFELKKTIIFVTHSLDESLYLADRIVLLTYRPGQVKSDILVDLPRPRDVSSIEFNTLKKDIGVLLMEEQKRFIEAEFTRNF